MKVLREDDITQCDVDNTLVIWPKDPHIKRPGTIAFNYGDEIIYLFPHTPHIRFLKHCFNRGNFTSVWSQNGWAWAEQVVRKLNLVKFVDEVRGKPTRHIDDKNTIEDLAGNRIFMTYIPEGMNE